MQLTRHAALVIALLAIPGAVAGVPRVLCSNIANSASATVPGASGWVYRPGFSTTTSFIHSAVSPDGAHWALVAWCRSGANDRVAIVHGTALSQGGTDLLARTLSASYVPARTYDALNPTLSVTDDGMVLFTGSLSGATTDDAFAVRWNSGAYTEIAREGQPLPGLATGVLYGGVIDTATFSSNGSALLRVTLGGSASGQAWLRTSSPTSGLVLARSGVTSPTSQFFSPPQTITSFVFDQCTGDQAGSASLVRARLNGPTATDELAMVNGVVIAQEGAVLPGSVFTFPIESLTPQLWGYSISRDGSHWALLGSNADTQDWASLDNTVFYKTGDPIIPGDTRTFDDTSYSLGFVGASVNSLGQLALAARTSTGDDAIVLAGERVLVRAGDPVDLDANGLLDDGVYLANVAEGSVTFTDNQRLFAIVQLADSTTAIRGIAFITLDAATCNSIDFNNDALFPDTQDIADFLSVFAGGVCGGQAPADPPCNTDIDFNRDFLFPDTDDIAALLRVFAGGSCT